MFPYQHLYLWYFTKTTFLNHHASTKQLKAYNPFNNESTLIWRRTNVGSTVGRFPVPLLVFIYSKLGGVIARTVSAHDDASL